MNAIYWLEQGLEFFREIKDLRVESFLYSNQGNIHTGFEE